MHLKRDRISMHFLSGRINFFKSVVTQKKRGKTLSGKQIDIVLKILENLSSKGAIKRNSIDGDEEICDRILDAIGK